VKTLLIGGARSGKSALAQRWATERSTRVCTIVTGSESDPEMSARIAAHRRDRPPHWRVREELIHLGRALRDESANGNLILLDCLTLWISNCLWPLPPPTAAQPEQARLTAPKFSTAIDPAIPPIATAADPSIPNAPLWRLERTDFLDVLQASTIDVIIVTNEVGTGIVPNNTSSRVFRDEQGWLNQSVAALCDEVFFVTAGLPLRLKPT
jgi:adenosylcobinamide kinase / adenosylcobinamide-phosphate guanylyltransferase